MGRDGTCKVLPASIVSTNYTFLLRLAAGALDVRCSPYGGKRDLLYAEKRPTICGKETYYYAHDLQLPYVFEKLRQHLSRVAIYSHYYIKPLYKATTQNHHK